MMAIATVGLTESEATLAAQSAVLMMTDLEKRMLEASQDNNSAAFVALQNLRSEAESLATKFRKTRDSARRNQEYEDSNG